MVELFYSSEVPQFREECIEYMRFYIPINEMYEFHISVDVVRDNCECCQR